MLTRFGIRGKALAECSDDPPHVLLVVAPDEHEKTLLAEKLRLDEYDFASVSDPDEVARLEVTDERAFVLWKSPLRAQIAEAVQLGVHPVGVVLTRDQIAFFLSSGTLPMTSREYRNIEDVRDVLLAFLLYTVHHYVGHLRVIKLLSSELEKKITVSMENRHLLQMFALGESLVYYLDAIESNGAVLTKLRGLAAHIGLNPRQQQTLDDILLENQQAARQASIYSTVLSGLMDARGTIVNNNMNVLLKNLTIINVVFLPLNLVAGILGMSEWTMMTHGLDWRISYSIFMVGMAAFGWVSWILVTKLIDPSTARSPFHNSPPAARGNGGRG
jgi:magnesium transporter